MLQPYVGPEVLPNSAFAEAAAAFFQKEEVEEKKKEAILSTPHGQAARPVVDALLDNLFDDFKAEVVRPVVWPKSMPVGHPLLSRQLFVRLWDGQQNKDFWDEVKATQKLKEEAPEEEKKNLPDELDVTFWMVIRNSLCHQDGSLVFANSASPSVLEAEYSGPRSRDWTTAVYDQAMKFNGVFKAEDALESGNSSGTDSSESSSAS